MKYPQLTVKAVLSTAALSCVLAVSTAYAGGADVGGGNGSPAKIVRITATGLDALADQGDIVINGRKIDIKAMQDALANLKEIRPTHEQLPAVNGKPVCLINHPGTRMLEMNVPCFESYDEDTKLQMGFHEVWGLAFADGKDDTYYYSAKLVQKVKQRAPASEEAKTEMARFSGHAFTIISRADYDKDPQKAEGDLLLTAETNAIKNCELADGVPRYQPTSAMSINRLPKNPSDPVSLSAEGSTRCEIPKVKKLPLLGIGSKVSADYAHRATNFTKAGRAALLKAAEEGNFEGAPTKACLAEAVKNSKEIAQDLELRNLKLKIEEVIGPFALQYEVSFGIGPLMDSVEPKPTSFQGMLSVYTSNPESLQNIKGKIINFNDIYFAMNKKVYAVIGRSGEFKNIDCSVKKETVKKFLEALYDHVSFTGDELSSEADEVNSSTAQ